MRIWIAAFAYFGLSFSAIAADENRSDSPPRYCEDFSAEACSRIKAVVESKIRPDYCVPGFALGDKGLTSEQTRICWVVPMPRSPEEERAFSEMERTMAENSARNAAQRKREIDDARAMVDEGWEKYRNLIRTIMIGYKCGVLDKDAANLAILSIEGAMQDELIHSGYAPDLGLNGHVAVQKAIQDGKDALEHDACPHMSPASRGRLRSLINDLNRRY